MRGGSQKADTRRLRRWLRSALLLFALISPSISLAQGEAELRGELDRIYELLLDNPSDVELNRRFIVIALALNDYDAAIGAVERLIFYAPDDPALYVEAGRFYYQIESYGAARGYLEDALNLPTISPDLRRQASTLIEDIDRLTRPSPWAGIAQFGVRYQSNANVGPFPFGLPDELPAELPAPDWNVFGLGALSYSNAFNDNLILESTLSGYYADQFEIDRLDLGFAELVAGPRLVTDGEALSVKPYGIVQGVLLGADPYQRVYGGGILVRATFAEGWWFEPQFEYRDRRFYDSDDYPSATEQTGDYFTYAVNGSGQFREDLSWKSRVVFNENRSAVEHLSYDQYFASLGVRLVLPFPQDWVLTPFASVYFTEYKAIDPDFAETVGLIREDLQWNAGGTLEAPLLEDFVLGVQVQYTHNDSNYDRFTYENLQVMSGPIVRF